jgi:hypothetical protein
LLGKERTWHLNIIVEKEIRQNKLLFVCEFGDE